MKNINELKQERASKIAQMSTIVDRVMGENRSKNEAEAKLWNDLDSEVNGLDETIRMAERQEELNKRAGKPVEVRNEEKQPVSIQFRDWLKDSVQKGITASFNGLGELRADPIITSTDSAVINKSIAGGVDILTSPSEEFLRKLGITFYPGLQGNFIVPSMAEDKATFATESGDSSTADMSTSSLTLAARRVTHTQKISKETLVQTNPAIYTSILQNLVNGIWNAVTYDVFDTLETDAATQTSTKSQASYVNFTDILNLEASLGGLNISNAAYVTTPTGKAYLKGVAALTNQAPIWANNEVNGYPAYGVPAANAKKLYFGDFSRSAVGQWGGLEIIVDPYTAAKQGQIVLTVIGMFDTGVTNKRAFTFCSDTSLSA